MTRRSQKKKEAEKKARQQRAHHSAVQPAPMLFKRSVTLTDAAELFSSSILGNGFGQFQINANGINNPGTSTATRVPQSRIWDQYAAMFELYQVKKVHMKFIPYKWEYPGGTVTPSRTTGFPTWSIVDPEDTLPSNGLVGSYYSYGNCHDAKPYDEHRRSLNNYTDLGLSKQDSLILPTNGSAASRALYTKPACIGLLGRTPDTAAAGSPIGLMVYTVCYEFSGQRAPNVSQPVPLMVEDGAIEHQPLRVESIPPQESTLQTLTVREAENFRAYLESQKTKQ